MESKGGSRYPLPHRPSGTKNGSPGEDYGKGPLPHISHCVQATGGWQEPQSSPKEALISPSTVAGYQTTASPKAGAQRRGKGIQRLVYATKWFVVTILIGAILAIPMIVLRTAVTDDDSGSPDTVLQRYFQQQYQNLGFWISAWLLTSWILACLCHLIGMGFPYAFRWVAKYLNPGHRRYWRVFFAMKWPITLLGAIVWAYIAYAALIFYNDELTANYDFNALNNLTSTTNSGGNTTIHAANGTTFDDSSKDTVLQVQVILNDVLFNVILWTALYFIEKCLIVYISVHYHYRSHFRKLKEGKQMITALTALYEASVYLHPLHKDAFRAEDAIIHDARDSTDGRLKVGGKLSRVASSGGKKITSALGHLVSSDEDTHWFRPDSSYAVVSRALNHPTSAAALAKRIWVSLASRGSSVLTVNDIAAALGPHRLQEAQQIFNTLDTNENGDIQLGELVPTVVDIGAVRRNIYSGMYDINHALNTFDWIICLILAVGMIFFILISWVPQIKTLRDNLALIVVGGAFIVGRIGHEFFSGAIFILFKHAFDVADHVKLYNGNEQLHVACIVRRISLLYVVFERVDDGMMMQIPNDRLNTKRIENVTRSGLNREVVQLPIDYSTSFKDIELLRKELIAFITRKENDRDYWPHLSLHLKSIHDLSKMELQCSFWHKSNWQNEELRAARSSKFLCALLAACRKVPINKPGGSNAKTGDEGKPSYFVAVTEEDAAKKRAEEKDKQAAKRMDYVEPEPSAADDADSSVRSAETAEERRQRKQAEQEEAEKQEEARRKKEEDRQAEEQARGSFMGAPLEPESQSPTTAAAATTQPPPALHHVDSGFSFISGREIGHRRTAVGPGQDAPFYGP